MNCSKLTIYDGTVLSGLLLVSSRRVTPFFQTQILDESRQLDLLREAGN